jgi:hypothetical protein
MFANQYPNEVVGMVLVDSSHPDQDDRFPPEAKKLAAASYYVIRVMQFTLPFGLPRLLASRSVPPEVRPEFCAVFCRRQYLAAVRAEAAAQQENSAQVRALTSLGNLPLLVLSHDPDKVRFPGKSDRTSEPRVGQDARRVGASVPERLSPGGRGERPRYTNRQARSGSRCYW